MLDRPGAAFHDPEADAALFEAIEKTVRETTRRVVQRVKANINDTTFVNAVIEAFDAIAPPVSKRSDGARTTLNDKG